MVRKVITPEDLSPTSFGVNPASGKVSVLISRADYPLTWEANVSPRYVRVGDGDQRRMCVIQDGFGKIHLDFAVGQVGVSSIATLPADCPTSPYLIETQLPGGGTIWLPANSRTVKASGLSINTRYIVDLIGFFELG